MKHLITVQSATLCVADHFRTQTGPVRDLDKRIRILKPCLLVSWLRKRDNQTIHSISQVLKNTVKESHGHALNFSIRVLSSSHVRVRGI